MPTSRQKEIAKRLAPLAFLWILMLVIFIGGGISWWAFFGISLAVGFAMGTRYYDLTHLGDE